MGKANPGNPRHATAARPRVRASSNVGACWFLAPGMTREYNEQTANEIIDNILYASGQ